MKWSSPEHRQQIVDEHMAYSSLEDGCWIGVFADGRVVCGKDEVVIRLPKGAAEAVVACKAFANRKTK